MKKMNERFKINIFYDKEIKFKFNINKFVIKILKNEKQNNFQINLIFVDNKKIKQLNTDFRNKNSETDVISFTYNEKTHKFLGGDIFISVDVAEKNAKKYRVDFEQEILRLIAHGVLHILGYDHTDDFKSTEIMKKKQEKYINEFLKEC